MPVLIKNTTFRTSSSDYKNQREEAAVRICER
jgi:hypothetical protein